MSPGSISEIDQSLLKCLENLQKIRQDKSAPAQFWLMYLEALKEVCSAEGGLIAVRGLKEGASWQSVAFTPQSLKLSPFAKTLAAKLDDAVIACAKDGSASLESEGGADIIALNLQVGMESQRCLALLYFGRVDSSRISESRKILELLNDIPANYQLCRSAYESITRQEQFANVLDLMMLMNTQDRFLSSAMTFCNELASRHKCERVSLGWLKNGYVRVQAMSHVDDFDKKMDVVQKLELAMEESFDQDADIILPTFEKSKIITRDHESLMRAQDVSFICSMPLRVNNEPVAVCTFERNESGFRDVELRLIRLSCDQATRRLNDLKHSDRWFGARLAVSLRKKLEGLLGCRHTWAKALGIFIFILGAFLCFVPVTYRLESPLILKTDDISYLTAPFDGHIEGVNVRVGDEIKEKDELLRLDRNDLFLEEAGLIAEKNRYKREAEKARAANALADMRISEALYEQSAARLDLVRHRLNQAIIKAPSKGFIIEGDQKERVGSPVKQGDVLFKLGRIEGIYAELEVRESEIHNVNTSLDGEIALASRPQDTFKINVFRIEPAAVSKQEGNVFLVHCKFPEEFPHWWKPGMTGLSKLNAGKRTLLWILTHRTVDFLRLKLWW